MAAAPSDMVAGWSEMQATLRSLQAEIQQLRSLHLQSSGSLDPALVRQNESFAYAPCKRHIEVCTYGMTAEGVPKCSLTEPFFLSPLSVEEKKSLRASSHAMLGRDYSPPPVPDWVVLHGGQKPWDSQLREVQYQLGQTVKWLDYFMDLHTRSEPDHSMATALSFMVAFRRSLADQASAITQTRLNNYFKFANLPCKAPPISADSAPHMVNPSVVRDLVASAKAAKEVRRSSQPDVRSVSSKSNKKTSRRGRKPTPKQSVAGQDETAPQNTVSDLLQIPPGLEEAPSSRSN
ncbi:hypothetical protein BGZ73_001729, partial [Actinomortierella ambigua]